MVNKALVVIGSFMKGKGWDTAVFVKFGRMPIDSVNHFRGRGRLGLMLANEDRLYLDTPDPFDLSLFLF